MLMLPLPLCRYDAAMPWQDARSLMLSLSLFRVIFADAILLLL